jgi:MFS family permease
VAAEAEALKTAERPSLASAFRTASWRDGRLFGISQAGFVNNLNDALAWGVFPLFFVSRGLSLEEVSVLAAVYPLVWGALQMATGWASDSIGRAPLIVAGMLMQGAAISLVGFGEGFGLWLIAVATLGVGTAMVYPVLLASISDNVHPESRATFLGVYRFWRDAGAMAGALSAGAIADAFGFEASIQAVAVLTAVSGVVAAMALRQREREVMS